MSRRVPVVRAVWGAGLLIAPGGVLRCLPHRQIDRPARVLARVLGARELTQAMVEGSVRGSRYRWILAGAAVDATHASTMLALAWRLPDRRRLALTNAATAGAFAAAGLHRARA